MYESASQQNLEVNGIKGRQIVEVQTIGISPFVTSQTSMARDTLIIATHLKQKSFCRP